MKKRILLLTLVLCLLLASCGKAPKKDEPSPEKLESNEPMPGFDAQNKYLLMGLQSFQETENFYLGCTINEEYQHFYDRKSGISGFLCADPACGHDTKECAAFMGGFSYIFCYDGKLYWIGGGLTDGRDCLWRSDLAGTNREKVKPISFEEIAMVYNPQQYAVHRGKLYFWGKADTIVGTEAGRRVSLLSTTLDGSDEYTVLYDKMFAGDTTSAFRFVGNRVYFFLDSYTTGGPSHVTVTKIDLDTGESEVVYDENDPEEYIGTFWVTQEGEIYLPGSDKNRAYLWKVENGKRVEVASWESGNYETPTLMDGIAVTIYRKDDKRWVDVVDFTGEPIYSGALFPEALEGLDGDLNNPIGYGIVCTGGDPEKLILNLVGTEEPEDATVLLDLTDNMKATVLWTSEK